MSTRDLDKGTWGIWVLIGLDLVVLVDWVLDGVFERVWSLESGWGVWDLLQTWYGYIYDPNGFGTEGLVPVLGSYRPIAIQYPLYHKYPTGG
ncbi:hypothetical protein G9A89_000706 [Geosiphon pyriformis]|nr:hypothetical protein G9A89_000706 [Geosiphon pyriformis]